MAKLMCRWAEQSFWSHAANWYNQAAKGDDSMRKLYIGLGIFALALLLLTSAFAFSLTLQNLRLNALSFGQPAAALVIAAPMTSATEAEIASPDSEGVRLEEFVRPDHVCNKDKLSEHTTDF